jgi:hypothetical protein
MEGRIKKQATWEPQANFDDEAFIRSYWDSITSCPASNQQG